MNILILLFGAVVLDLLIGDPSWIPHPVVLIGKLISKEETLLRKAFPQKLRLAGKILAVTIPLFTLAVTFLLLWVCYQVHPLFGLAVEIFLGSLTLAAKSLKKESMLSLIHI